MVAGPLADDETQLVRALVGAWDSSMDQFYTAADAEAKKRGLSDDQVRRAIERGYGIDAAAGWAEWAGS